MRILLIAIAAALCIWLPGAAHQAQAAADQGVMMVSRAAGPGVGAASPAGASAIPFDAAKGAPGKSELRLRYAGNDAVVLFDSLVASRDADGRVSKRRHRAVMLLTDNAINRYGDPRILFNAAKQELTVLTARVYMRDGTIADTQKNGINRTTPFALEAAPDYTDWQETVVTHVGIEKGCIAELQYVIADNDPSPWLSGVEVFGAEDPTLERTVMVRLPAGAALQHASLNGAPGPALPSTGVYVWTVKDIPGRTPFDGGAWEGDYFPTVVYGTAAGWRDVLGAMEQSIGDALHGAESFQAKVDEAVKDAKGFEDRILKIHRMELGCVSAVRPPFSLFGAPPRTANRIYESAYATPLDRAVLLMGMIRAAGFDNPLPVLVSSGKSWPGDIPAPEVFGKILVAVSTDQGAYILDPGAPYEHGSAFTLAGRTLIDLDGQGTVVRFPARRADESRTSLDITLKPGDDGALAGEGVAAMTGLFSPYYVIRGTGDETKEFITARCAGMFGGADVTSWNLLRLDPNRVELAFHFTVKLPDKKSGERAYLPLPKPLEAALSGIDRARLERSYCPDALACEPSMLEVTCTLEEPPGWKIVALPPAGNEENAVGSARVEVDSRPDGKRVCRRALTVQTDIVRPESYGMLRSLLLRFGGDQLVLERK